MSTFTVIKKTSRSARVLAGMVLTACLTLTLASPSWASFGVERFEAPLEEQGGAPTTQAGSHPYELTASLAFAQHFDAEYQKSAGGAGILPDGDPRDLEINLPAGVVVNPNATETRCTESQIESSGDDCPASSAVGVATIDLGNILGVTSSPVYNMVAPSGVPGDFAFDAEGIGAIIHIVGKVRSGGDYGLSGEVSNITQKAPVDNVSVTLWGDPSAASHDAERGGCIFNSSLCLIPVERVERPFLTVPGSCAGPLIATMTADSWQEPGIFSSAPPFAGAPITGCERLAFTPSIEAKPETEVADTPTGLSVDLKVPQDESVTGLAEASLREAVVTLPAGLSVSPAAANGLGACSEAQIGLNNAAKPTCPDSSKLARVKIVTPLLEAPLEGSLYLAQQGNAGAAQGQNPYGSLFALYLVAEGSGTLIKLPGKVTLDQSTGQLSAHFGQDPVTGQFLPQLPFSELKMEFFGGPQATLVTPSSCGSYTTRTQLTPWSSPFSGPPATPQSGFSITSGCAGGFAPSFSGGTSSNQAGGYSPFTVTFSRADGEQALQGIQVHTPPGLLGTLSHVPLCAEAQAQAGTCGSESQIGTVAVAAGAGADPFWITDGRAYLTGPYRGAPFGLSVVVPAVAGPFNLGNVVVRAAIGVDPATAALTITSDPLPQIIEGVPLQIRTVSIDVNRPQFTFNPTSCTPSTIGATLQGAQGATAGPSAPFQAADCSLLPFHPGFEVSTAGHTSKAGGASLDVRVSSGAGQANIRSVAVSLPRQLPARLTTIQQACRDSVFDANPAACPVGSQIGIAMALSPVLPVSLTGPAYLVSHGGAAFPDLVVVLQGDGVRLDLTGSIDIKGAITSSTFASIPDAPVRSFELYLPEGPHSALAANLPAKAKGSQCSQTLVLPTTIVGQNGAVVKQSTKIAVTGCAKAGTVRKKTARKRTAKKARKASHHNDNRRTGR
jgi:hypothetical protein